MAAFKPPFLAFFLAALAFLAQVTLCLEIKVTGTSNGQPIDPASIVLDANPPRLHSPPSRRASPGGATAEPLEKRQIYSDDWCGAISSTPTTNKITNVQGYFQVPTPSLLVDGDYPQYVGAWIGIDGVTWGSSLLQAGTTSAIAPGEVDYWAWFQWYPSPAYSLPNFAVSPGDWIYVSVTPSSATAAILTIMNYSNQLNYTFELSDGDALGQQDADWVIEDPYNITSQTNLPAFGTVWFEDVYATTENGSYLDASTATYSWLDYPPLCESTKYDAYDFYAQWSGNG